MMLFCDLLGLECARFLGSPVSLTRPARPPPLPGTVAVLKKRFCLHLNHGQVTPPRPFRFVLVESRDPLGFRRTYSKTRQLSVCGLSAQVGRPKAMPLAAGLLRI